MAKSDALYDNDASPKKKETREARRGDERKLGDGVEEESIGQIGKDAPADQQPTDEDWKDWKSIGRAVDAKAGEQKSEVWRRKVKKKPPPEDKPMS